MFCVVRKNKKDEPGTPTPALKKGGEEEISLFAVLIIRSFGYLYMVGSATGTLRNPYAPILETMICLLFDHG
jgi:hypothetical protein